MALLPILLDMVDEIYDNLDNPSKNFSEVPLLFLPQRSERVCPRMSKRERGCPKRESSEPKECPTRECPKANEKEEETKACTSAQGSSSKGKCEKNECPRTWNALAFYDHPWSRQLPLEVMRRYHHGGLRKCPVKTSDDFHITIDVKSFKPEEISVKVKERDIIVEGKHEERADEFGFVSRQFTRRYILPEDYDIDTVSSYLSADGKMIIKASKPKPVLETGERIIPIERVKSTQEREEEAETEATAVDNAEKAADANSNEEKPKE